MIFVSSFYDKGPAVKLPLSDNIIKVCYMYVSQYWCIVILQDKGEQSLWFMFQKTKYLYDGEEKKTFVSVEFPVAESVQTYLDWKGYQDDEEIRHAENKFGKNM